VSRRSLCLIEHFAVPIQLFNQFLTEVSVTYKFEPGKQYRMPTHFGPALGPRQGPDGRTYDCVDNPKSTSISVSFVSNPDQLSAILPEGFEVEEPIVTVTVTHMKEIEWLAGRGYATLGLTFPAVFKGKEDTARGPFLTVLWENLADPIITGREDIGFSKIYCELPEPRFCNGEAHATAGWLGFQFLGINVTNLGEKSVDDAGGSGSKVDGMLHYKYMPRTEDWGESDSAYAVMTPATGGNRRVIEYSTGDGTLEWHRARWEDLPTQYNIVNTFANLEVKEYVGGSVTRTIGAKDLSDQCILR